MSTDNIDYSKKKSDDPDKILQCPYNEAHMIRQFKMQVHLVKCRKSFPNAKTQKCPYNSTHDVPDPEFEYHVNHCPARISIDKFYYHSDEVKSNRFPLPDPNENIALENWDDEPPCPTYDPKIHCQKEKIIRFRQVDTPSERRNFRMEERQRHQNLSGQPQSSQSTVDAEIREETHMRMPTMSSRHLQGGLQTQAEPNDEEDRSHYSNVLRKVKFGGTTAAIPRQPVVSTSNLPGTSNAAGSNGSGVFNARGRPESSEENNGFWPLPGSQGRGRFFTK